MLILDNQIDKFHAPVTFVHRGGKLCPTMSPKMVHRMCDRNLVLQTNYRRIWRVWVWLSDISMKDAIWISNNAIRQARLSRRSRTLCVSCECYLVPDTYAYQCCDGSITEVIQTCFFFSPPFCFAASFSCFLQQTSSHMQLNAPCLSEKGAQFPR